MRFAYGVLALSVTGLCGAVAIPAHQDATAESTFKNIVSFKGQKASDVLPAMQFMSASLKVSCDYCHAEDRASDEKEEKKTAREMIEMQRDINMRHFNGRNQVTCATCHAGHTRPVNLPPVVGMEVRTRRSQTVKPNEVLSAYSTAVGGDAVKAIGGLEFKGSSITNGVKSPLEATYSNDKFVIDTKMAKSDVKMGFNGTLGWFTTPKGIQSVPLVYCISYVNEKALFMGVDSLPKIDNPSGGTAQISGRDNLVVSGVQADKTRVSMYFDKQTGLLTRTMFSYPSILGSTAKITDYSDYRKVNGVQIAMTVVNHATEGDTVEQFKSVKVAGKIDSAFFDPPKG